MKKTTFLICCFLQSILVFSQTLNGPESIEWDQDNTRWLIGNKGNGTVLARNENGVLSNFVTGIGSGPYGIEILGDVLYTCEGGFIRGYLLTTGATVFTLNLNATFLNGLTSDGNNFLYATDFTAKKIFKIDVASVSFTTMASGLAKTPNGILYDGENNRCVFVTWGSNAPIMAIDLTTNAVSTVLATTLSNCDGITRDRCGNYYVSSWGNNRLNRFDASLTGTHIVLPTALSSPADLDTRMDVTADIIGNTNANNTITLTNVVLPTATIVYGNVTLTTTEVFDTYQWYLDGDPIVGATQQTYVPSVQGDYYCVVTKNNCVAESNVITAPFLSNDSFDFKNNAQIYPNPASDFIDVSFNGNWDGNYNIINTLGQVVWSAKEDTAARKSIRLSVSDLKTGLYIVELKINGVIQKLKFLKK
ncbi:T9SS type A sorting domain-containing protein [Flavobacterium sp. CYK-4]|uniref:T9SS type A sorting domain-containing protein n=1 Tax=Flavobacterium lotistagni TaxID=2709660 RepID=UPI00140C04D8|nr:T9SS type A sorting domain-containing protein [Flavobacterium lotistagni]NHM07882.1 T9SS type A sorting domain-containing protein [Flavobacterium lotistagni]